MRIKLSDNLLLFFFTILYCKKIHFVYCNVYFFPLISFSDSFISSSAFGLRLRCATHELLALLVVLAEEVVLHAHVGGPGLAEATRDQPGTRRI